MCAQGLSRGTGRSGDVRHDNPTIDHYAKKIYIIQRWIQRCTSEDTLMFDCILNDVADLLSHSRDVQICFAGWFEIAEDS